MDRTRLTDRVAAELRKLMVNGAYPPGSRLPSGQELAEQLGVTRLTVREALAQLEAAGFTRTRHGSGTYVVDQAENATLQMHADALGAGRGMSRDEVESLLDFRAVMVCGFMEAISAHLRPEQLQKLRQLLTEERQALGQPSQLAELDLRFNELLAAASGNHFYVLLLRSLRKAHLHLGEIVFRHCGDGRVVVDTHEAIVKALEQRQPAQLRKRIRLYLEGGNEIVRTWLKSQP